ncbi:MAG: WecB/TagA/CpsF family glycosyltransferase [Tannerellaceae bacterium]|nr:WecB/TagA/CpsF family glycosyltransferase [Tannerellaceae bacterium]
MDKVLLGSFCVSNDFYLSTLPTSKTIINTINAYSWCIADKDPLFKMALRRGDVLLPDGISIVWAAKYLKKEKIKKVAGADVHNLLLKLLEKEKERCFYLGASEETLLLIKERIKKEYPSIQVGYYSPPYKQNFSSKDNEEMLNAINTFKPKVVFVGMTAPKQEKWIYTHANKLPESTICAIGAVFDFYAGTKSRPLQWMINYGLEWLGRLITEPRRLWKRYIGYNLVFIYKIVKLKLAK